MNCPGSLNLTSKLGESPSSIYAAEGTWAHQIREDCLELGLDPSDFVGHRMWVDGYWFEWTDKDAAYLQTGIDRIRQFDGRMVVEYKVDLNRWMPGDFGTLDCGIISDKLIVINDLKWGQGEPVDAHQNTQQMIYALGFWHNIARHETKATDFLLMIDQPRVKQRGRRDPVIQFEDLDAEEDEDEDVVAAPGEFRITLDELLEFGKRVRAAAKATEDPDAPRIPGKKQCRWCAAARIEGACPEYENWIITDLGLKFENLDEAVELGTKVRMPRVLSVEHRARLLDSWSDIVRWYERMHADALLEALSGNFDAVPGLKAVEGRSPARKWVDEAFAYAFLAKPVYADPETLDQKRGKSLSDEKIFTRKLISPAKAETLLGKGTLPAALVDRGKPKPVLASANDPKPAITPLKIEFDNLENEANDENGERENG